MHALLLAPTTFRFTLPMLLRHNIIAPTPNHNKDDALVANANARLQGKRTLGVCNFKSATLRAVCCPETSAYARRTLGVRRRYLRRNVVFSNLCRRDPGAGGARHRLRARPLLPALLCPPQRASSHRRLGERVGAPHRRRRAPRAPAGDFWSVRVCGCSGQMG